MAYIKTIWKDRLVERPNTFEVQENPDGTITLIPQPGVITEQGTPINAANLNNIENGIEGLDNALATHLAENASKHIAESGSNENGSYIRFDDGTMICSRTAINLTYDNEKRLGATWTYPATFTSQPAISLIYKHTATFAPTNHQIGQMYMSGASGSTSAIIYVPRIEGMTDFQNEDTMVAYSIAIGRWK